MSNVSVTIWLDEEAGEIFSRTTPTPSIKIGDCTMFVRDIGKARTLITELSKVITYLKEVENDRLQVLRDNAQAS